MRIRAVSLLMPCSFTILLVSTLRSTLPPKYVDSVSATALSVSQCLIKCTVYECPKPYVFGQSDTLLNSPDACNLRLWVNLTDKSLKHRSRTQLGKLSHAI